MNPEPYAVVIGGVNIDICGRSFAPLIEKDSNPGRVSTSLGGVGRNIAHNMAMLGINVVFLTAFGEDIFKDRIEAVCAEQGIDIRHARKVPKAATSMYVFLGGPDGDMVLAVSDMKICENITPDYIETKLEIINDAALAVVDANLPEETIRYLLENARVPVFADPVSAAKTVRISSCLDRIHTIKPNRLEAQVLTGLEITDEVSARAAVRTLLEKGVQQVFLTLGTQGVTGGQRLPSAGGEQDQIQICHQPCIPAQSRNATGAGDAFMAGLVWSYLQGYDMEKTIKAASAAAAITVESEETISSVLSPKAIKKRAGI